MQSNTVNFSHIIGKQTAHELSRGLLAAMEVARDGIVAVHCRDTHFAVVVECHQGQPFQWHIQGPLTENQAAAFVASFDLAKNSPDSVN